MEVSTQSLTPHGIGHPPLVEHIGKRTELHLILSDDGTLVAMHSVAVAEPCHVTTIQVLFTLHAFYLATCPQVVQLGTAAYPGTHGS